MSLLEIGQKIIKKKNPQIRYSGDYQIYYKKKSKIRLRIQTKQLGLLKNLLFNLNQWSVDSSRLTVWGFITIFNNNVVDDK